MDFNRIMLTENSAVQGNVYWPLAVSASGGAVNKLV